MTKVSGKKATKRRRLPKHVVRALGVVICVTFDTWAEEARVRAKAEREGVSVEDLIYRAIDKASRRNYKYDVHEMIVRAIKVLAKPTARTKRRKGKT